jgi:predicted GNAT family acetyltransferase
MGGMTAVTHAPDRSRFEAGEAYLEYALDGSTLTIEHTIVPEAMSGQGVGGELVRAALAHVRAEGLELVVVCPFAKKWLAKHPDA